MRPLRVLHSIGEMGTGGAESLVAEMMRRGGDVGWISEVASAGGRREDELVRDGHGPAHRVPLSRRRPLGLLRAVGATRRAVRLADPDVVVAHNVGVTAAAWTALRSLRRDVALVTVFHGVAAEDYVRSARLLSRAPDAVVTVSGVIRDRLVDAGLQARRIIVIPNSVTAPDLPPREAARAALKLPDDVPVALCIARLVDQKRHDILLHAWAKLPEPAILLVAGEGPNAERIQTLTVDLGLQDRVRLLGPRSDVPSLLAAADLTTLASDWEGLPIAVLESMAAGRPVVATEVDGVAEALRHGGGVLVPPRAPDALADALSALLTDRQACAAVGAQAARVVSTHYDPTTMMRRYDRVLRRALRPGHPSAPTPTRTDI